MRGEERWRADVEEAVLLMISTLNKTEYENVIQKKMNGRVRLCLEFLWIYRYLNYRFMTCIHHTPQVRTASRHNRSLVIKSCIGRQCASALHNALHDIAVSRQVETDYIESEFFALKFLNMV